MTTSQPASPYGFRYIGTHRRTKEDPRFVTGRGRYAADIALPGLKHVAIVASPHASARILSIRTDAARAMPGVHYVLTGEEFCAATDSLPIGVDAPKVTRYALASDVVRYAGEWVAAVVADTRALAEDAAELVEVDYEPLPHVIDPEEAMARAARWCIRRTARTSSCTGASSGARSRRRSRRRSTSSRCARCGAAARPCRSRPSASTAQWDPRHGDPRRLGVDPDAEISRPDRAGAAPARQRGARALRRGRRRQLRRQARPQAHRAGRLPRASGSACRCASSRTGWRTCAAATCRAPTASST